MQYREFGKTSWKVSSIGFGAWAIGGSWGEQKDDESLRTLHTALDKGVNFIDTAAGYGGGHSEQLIGQVLKERSEQIYVATKTPPDSGAWPPDPRDPWENRYSEKYLRENIETRLKFLGTEQIDLLQLHTWTRAWNADPQPLLILQKLKEEGKIRAIGISTPEHDQNCAVDLIRHGLIDSVQLIYNIFEQEPAAELLPMAQKHGVGVIVRVAFDEGALTGKFSADHTFAENDFRRNYFAGDRIQRTVERVKKIQADLPAEEGSSLAETALRFVLDHPAVSTVIPGMRTVAQAEANTAVSDLPPMDPKIMETLYGHQWRRAFWYGGK